MDVIAVGDGPAIAAVEAALSDVNVALERSDVDAVEAADLAVVCDRRGAERFERANRAALRGETAWFAVAVGGLGGDSGSLGVAGFSPPDTACHQCLARRVTAADRASESDAPDPGVERYAGALVGREIVALLTGRSSTLLGGVATPSREWAIRELLPDAGCRYRHLPEIFTLDYRKPRDPADDIELARRAVDDLVGPVRTVEELGPYPAACVVASLAPSAFPSEGSQPVRVAAAGPDWERATARCLRRALGRYSSAVSRHEPFITASREELPLTVDTEPLEEFGVGDHAETAEREWTLGRRLADGTPGHVPASAVYPDGREPPVGVGTATAGAMLAALYEVVAHDAATLSWYSTHDPPRLRVDDDRFRMLEHRANAEGLAVTPLLVTQDIDIPAVTVAVHREEWPRFAVGVAAALDPAVAATGALCDALANWLQLDAMGPDDATDHPLGRYADHPVGAFCDPHDHVGAETVRPSSVPDGFQEFLTAVERAGKLAAPYGVRLTTTDVASLGFEVGRVLVPGTQSLPADGGDPFGAATGRRRVPRTATERVRALGEQPRPERERHPYPVV